MTNKILKDKYLRVVFGIGFLIFLITVVFSLVKFLNFNDILIIHSDAFRGIDVVGSKFQVFGILVSASAMMVVNLLLANFVYQRERFLSYLFSFVNLILSILFLIVIMVISAANS